MYDRGVFCGLRRPTLFSRNRGNRLHINSNRLVRHSCVHIECLRKQNVCNSNRTKNKEKISNKIVEWGLCLGLTCQILLMQPVLQAKGAEESGGTITINRDYFEQLLLNEFSRRVDDMSEEQLQSILAEILKDQRSTKAPKNNSKQQIFKQQQNFEQQQQQQKSIPTQTLKPQQEQDILVPNKQIESRMQSSLPAAAPSYQSTEDSNLRPKPNTNNISDTPNVKKLVQDTDQLEEKFQFNKLNQRDSMASEKSQQDLTENLLQKQGVEVISPENIPNDSLDGNKQVKQRGNNMIVDGLISVIVFAFDKMLWGFQGLGKLFRETAGAVKLDGALLRNIFILSTLALAVFLATKIRVYLTTLQILVSGNLNEIVQQFNKARNSIFGAQSNKARNSIFGAQSNSKKGPQNQNQQVPNDQIKVQNFIPQMPPQISPNQNSGNVQWQQKQNQQKQVNGVFQNNNSVPNQLKNEDQSFGDQSPKRKVLWTRQSGKSVNNGQNINFQQNNTNTSSFESNKVISNGRSTNNIDSDTNGVNIHNGDTQFYKNVFQHAKDIEKNEQDQKFKIDAQNGKNEYLQQDPWRVPREKVLQTDNGVK